MGENTFRYVAGTTVWEIDSDVASVTFHTHTDRSERAYVGIGADAASVRARLSDEIRFLLESAFHLRGVPASEFDGLVVRIGGVRVGVVDSKGIDLVDDEEIVEWFGNLGNGTVISWVRSIRN